MSVAYSQSVTFYVGPADKVGISLLRKFRTKKASELALVLVQLSSLKLFYTKFPFY